MDAILGNLRNTVIAGFVLAGLVFLIYIAMGQFNAYVFWPFFVRWMHIISGVMWIGLLWYFNFVQTPTMPKIPEDQKSAISKFIAPEALFWFRWSAMSTLVFGIILAALNGYLVNAYTLDMLDGFSDLKTLLIGIGMWLGTIMWFNVWFIIWPNQRKALNINNAFPDLSKEMRGAAAKASGRFSRINTMFSFPMLFCMAAATHLFA